MNKSKIILAAVGGAIVLLVAVMAFFVWSASSKCTAAYEGDDDSEGLDTVVALATTLSRKPIYPSAASIKAISSNREIVVSWKDDAFRLAARGDRAFPATTPAAFKTFIVSDAKRLAEGFEFGPFKDYVAGGKMPEANQLATLQRQWDDVAVVTEVLSASGMKKLTGLEFKAAAQPQQEEAQPKKGKKKAKKGAKVEADFAPARETYVFTFTIPPTGLVKAVNALETNERFIVVDDFSFRREKDVLVEALGGEQKEAASGGRRGRRGRRGAQQEEQSQLEAAAAKNGIITDPALDPPLLVTLTVSVYDFRSLEEKKETTEE